MDLEESRFTSARETDWGRFKRGQDPDRGSFYRVSILQSAKNVPVVKDGAKAEGHGKRTGN